MKISTALFRMLGLKPRYQINRAFTLKDRWKLISSCIAPGDRTALDIGCNLGEITALLAQQGMFAVGLDVVTGTIQQAVKRNAGRPNLAFGVAALSPDNVNSLPPVDITLCLSVSHYWHRDYGEEPCWEMIRTLILRSRSFIIEVASIRQKYGTLPPEIMDNDEESVRSYFTRRLNDVAGPGRGVRFLGKAKSLGREQFRYMFVVEKV
jgi:SAM-dependent methyltransferase